MGSDSSPTFIHFWLIPPYEICTISEYVFGNSGGSKYWFVAKVPALRQIVHRARMN